MAVASSTDNCLQFNRADTAPGRAIYQDLPFATSSPGVFNVEVALRCHGGGSCPVHAALFGLNTTALGSPHVALDVPGDGAWRHYWFRTENYTAHNTLRYQVINYSAGRNVDVDFPTVHWDRKEAS